MSIYLLGVLKAANLPHRPVVITQLIGVDSWCFAARYARIRYLFKNVDMLLINGVNLFLISLWVLPPGPLKLARIVDLLLPLELVDMLAVNGTD